MGCLNNHKEKSYASTALQSLVFVFWVGIRVSTGVVASLSGGLSAFLSVVLVIVLFFLGLNLSPLLLADLGMLEGAVFILEAVVADDHVPPELVEAEGAQDDVGVVHLVVLADPPAGEPPEGLHAGGGSETGHFLLFTLESGVA